MDEHPEEPGHEHHRRVRGSVWGIFLIVVGGWWLLSELDYLPFKWEWVGPLAIIGAGVTMLLRRGQLCC